MALVVAVLALAVVGVLVSASVTASLAARRGAAMRLDRLEALAAAELGLERVRGAAPIGAWRAMPPGSSASSGSWQSGRATVRTTVTRLGDSAAPAVLLRARATVGTVPGRRAARELSLTMTVHAPLMAPPAALTVRAPVHLGAGAAIDGADLPPAGWSCPAPGPWLPGIATDDASGVSSGSCGPLCVGGAPPVLQAPLASDSSTYFTMGEMGWGELAAAAKRVPAIVAPAPAVSGGACLTSDAANWGDPGRGTPTAPCEGYAPALYAPGDLALTGGLGQGTLLVDGDLTVSGGARFAGVVIVRGRLLAAGVGGRIEGAVLAAGAGAHRLDAPLAIVHSRCAIRAALAGAEALVPIPGRGWLEVY